MSLPKGLNYDAKKDLYRLRLYYKGSLAYEKCFKDKQEALFYYPKAIAARNEFISKMKKQEPNTILTSIDNFGLIRMLQTT